MKTKYKFILAILLIVAAAAGCGLFIAHNDVAVLQPKGMIGHKERTLLFTASLLMLIVVIPVLVMTFVFAWKYREENKKAKYSPNWAESHVAEAVWWGVPFVIITILAIVTWKSSHDLSPFKPIESDKKPLTVQVVALQWKWLFIYPEQKIASINFLQIPEKTPISFEITADAPMNSFWIPQLGGQIYAMPAMRSKLHLIADEVGEYRGCSSNLSGDGFAGMDFIAKSCSENDFNKWVQQAKKSQQRLSLDEYTTLVEPSQNNDVSLYSLTENDLFEEILKKYTAPKPKR